MTSVAFSSPAANKMLQELQELPEVARVLRTIRRLTGLRISLIARVAAGDWTCCAVLDDADFGLEVGATLDVSTTY